MIGIFDSGFGGLTVFKEIKKALPDYNYIYLGDNLRAPYGDRGQEIIYQFTEQAVNFLFKQGCDLVILACNTASSDALKKLQQEWLPANYPNGRILGVIRPLTEEATKVSRFGKIGVVGTTATIKSGAYLRELKHLSSLARLCPTIKAWQQACPLLVPLIEEGWLDKTETRMILKKYLRPLKDQQIDTLILGCTHYPLLMKEFKRLCGKRVNVLNAPKIIAAKLVDYLQRHPELEQKLVKQKAVRYLTTGDPKTFSKLGGKFIGLEISAEKIVL
ncbi:MAG: glutamate racemase [Candidatus Komeilibacteria bacterium]|nr:glutamate racemase [Candidatus Komeilibacteria bacterium]